MHRAACIVCNVGRARLARLHQPPRVRFLSTVAASEHASLSYDRDTGIVWETDASGETDSPSARPRIRPLYQTIVGIEIHAQLSIPTKLFSSAPTRHHPNYSDAAANTLVHPYDIAYPGTLPSLSLAAVQASLLSAAALNCSIHERSRFERKHYFYPDLPAGYQITQQRWPLASGGVVTFMPYFNRQPMKKRGKKKKSRRNGNSEEAQTEEGDVNQAEFEPRPVQLRIDRIQLEQDTGKTTTHASVTDEGRSITRSHIDYNRAGCALIEIVSHPDLRSAHEAAGVVEKIRKLLKHVGSCDGRMEEGSLRCDLNVSVAPIDTPEASNSREKLPPGNGQRVEVKNLNSLRQIVAATEYEALRLSSMARSNTPTGRETRTWHVKPTSEAHPLGGETFCIRAKGDAIDYRFMPEPDLPPLVLDEDTLGCTLEEFIERHMPESPEAANARLVNEYGLNEDIADVITGDPPAIELFEQTVETAQKELSPEESDEIATLSANWLCNDLFALVKKSATKGSKEAGDEVEASLNHPISVEYSPVDGERLGSLVAMVVDGTLTSSMAKKVLAVMFEDDHRSSPSSIAEANGWRVISDVDTLVKLCESVVLDAKNASQLEQYKLGGKKLWKIEKFFAGKVMAESKGNAHPEKMKEALAGVLEKVASE